MNEIEQALTRLFERPRIVLWCHRERELAEVVAPHADFFQAVRRREALRSILAAGDTLIRIAFVSVPRPSPENP